MISMTSLVTVLSLATRGEAWDCVHAPSTAGSSGRSESSQN